MKILLLGMSHRTAPVEVRERYAVEDHSAALQKLVALEEIDQGT